MNPNPPDQERIDLEHCILSILRGESYDDNMLKNALYCHVAGITNGREVIVDTFRKCCHQYKKEAYALLSLGLNMLHLKWIDKQDVYKIMKRDRMDIDMLKYILSYPGAYKTSEKGIDQLLSDHLW